jgi:hypothetical protein
MMSAAMPLCNPACWRAVADIQAAASCHANTSTHLAIDAEGRAINQGPQRQRLACGLVLRSELVDDEIPDVEVALHRPLDCLVAAGPLAGGRRRQPRQIQRRAQLHELLVIACMDASSAVSCSIMG